MPNRFMMAFIRKKKVKGKTYYYVVEGVYDEKIRPLIPKQKVVRYLGSVDNIIKKFDFWDEHH